jgi:hypothetical protein
MRRAHCPHCNNVNVIDDEEWGQLTQCEAPGCRRLFMTGGKQSETEGSPPPVPPRPAGSLHHATPAPPVPSAVPRPGAPVAAAAVQAPPKPLLTGPHVCHTCRGEIGQALCHRRATIVHRAAARDGQPPGATCRMDIYAAIYFCPNPRCQTLLETPRYQWSERVTCPSCSTSFEAPRDDILHEHEGDAREGIPFRFHCPSCYLPVCCDSTQSGRPMRGQRVVCPRCRQIIEVPGAGTAVREQGPAVPDPREVVQQGRLHRCTNPACGQMIPARAEVCPLCGERQGEGGE